MEENIYNELEKIPNYPPKVSVKMMALRGLVVFPGQTAYFDVARDKSLLALNKAVEDSSDIFLVTQKHSASTNPGPKDIYRVGVMCKIKQVIRMPGDIGVRALVLGVKRMEIDSYTAITPFFEVSLKEFIETPSDGILVEAVTRKLEEEFEKFKKLETKFPPDVIKALNLSDIRNFINIMGMHLYKTEADKQHLLEIHDEYSQLEEIYTKLISECEILTTEKRITAKVRASIDKSQREYYLREQIKAIHAELGENEDELEQYKKTAIDKKLPQIVLDKVNKEVTRMEKMSPTSPESGVCRTYIELLLEMPWTEMSEDNLDLIKAREILDADHYGLDKVKERIVEYLAVHQLTSSLKAPILCFVGPPGVGKTSVVSSIARASGRKLVSMSLGGVRDEAEIRGHRRTYIGAMPGRIISAMKQAEVLNPVFLLDEIDKMSSDFRGDPASAMLEVLDPNQNNAFKDNYLEIPYDLSKAMFVTTANTLEDIPVPLLDRMEVIELSGYTYEEKLQIAKKYLVPKQLLANGLDSATINIGDDVLMNIISMYTRESGVRNLEREIGAVIRKVAVKVVNSNQSGQFYEICKQDLTEYLGVVKYKDNLKNEADEVGLATGLAWTSVGGVTLNIEVALIPDGKGEITLTGSLGDVMKESCKAKQYNIALDKFTKYDIHVHIPEGATPKDGPSAGITMATALLSALSGKKVDRNVAMTGEVTLRGKVLPIGGLKEKSLAAFRSGVKKLIIPLDNKKDLDDIPDEVKNSMTIYFAENVDDVFAQAIVH